MSIDEIDITDADHDQDVGASLYRYFVANVLIGGAFIPVTGKPNIGVCALALPTDSEPGCQSRIRPHGAWSFTHDVDPALGTVDVLMQVRDVNPLKLNPLDLSPGLFSPAERGLAFTVNLVDGTWRVRGDSVSVSPSETSGSFGMAQDQSRLVGRVKFSVSFCGGIASCSTGTRVVCQGTPCTTNATGPHPACNNVPGTALCSPGFRCLANPTSAPELQNGQDDDCDTLVDECNANQMGQTFPCLTPLRACPSHGGVRTCTAADAPPGACVAADAGDANVCQVACPTEKRVTNVVELREAIAQAPLTSCKDVIVLDPGFYDLTSPLLINDSMEIRGIGSSYGCQGVDFDAKLPQNLLDSNLASLRCDGDEGEDPGATVIRNVAQPNLSVHRVMVIGDNVPGGLATSKAEVTLRHLTISGGAGTVGATPGTGIYAPGPSRLKLFNVVVQDNQARGPGAGIVHTSESSGFPVTPTFVMVNSTVRRNRSTTPPLGADIGVQGNGGGMRLSGVVFILRSTIHDNAAIRGAGVFASGAVHIYNSTITRNLSGQGGAGVLITARFNGPTFVELRHNTITNNFAQWFATQPLTRKDGAGVLAVGDVRAEFYGNVIAENVECRSQILAGLNGENCSADEGAAFVSLGSNVGSADCAFSPVVTLPGSGPVASDRVVRVGYARELTEPQFTRFNDPFQDAVITTCTIGFNITAVGDPSAEQLGSAQTEALANLPSSDREVFEHDTARHLRFFGPLSDQGGPTQTIAPAADSPVVGAGRSHEDPGYVTDVYPSAAPLCPIADQRGFFVSANVPAVCDAGSFQTLATAALSVDAAAQELRRLFPDGDGDGIADAIDGSPLAFSASFSDLASGGVTAGSIRSRGDQTLRLFDAFPNPGSGVLVLALSQGGAAPALISACGGTVEVSLRRGEQRIVTCPRQADVCVLGKDSLAVGDRGQMTVIGAFGGQVAFGPGQLSGNLESSGHIALARSEIGGNVTAAGHVAAVQAQIGGVVKQNAYVLPRTLTPQVVSPGTADVVLGHDQTRSLTPGAYRQLVVGDRARLTLAPGSYSFEGVTLRNDAQVVLAGVVRVKSRSAFEVRDRVRVKRSPTPPGPDLSAWYTNAALLSLGQDVTWSGTITAPLALVVLRDRARVEGCIAARHVVLGNDAKVAANRSLAASP